MSESTDYQPHPPGRPAIAHGRVHPVDWLMLALAVISVGLLAWETWWKVSPQMARWIVVGDYGVCAVFLAEFLWRWHAERWNRGFLLRNWYDVLGMIPASSPAIRGFRLFRVVRIVILLSRFGMAADRAVGEEFTYRLVNRFKDTIVDAVSDTITVAVLDEVAGVLKQGTYCHNIARALDENESELRNMIREKLRRDPRAGRFSRLPFYNEVVSAVIESGLHVVRDVLHDPRTDELVSDLLRENIQQLRTIVRHNTN